MRLWYQGMSGKEYFVNNYFFVGRTEDLVLNLVRSRCVFEVKSYDEDSRSIQSKKSHDWVYINVPIALLFEE